MDSVTGTIAGAASAGAGIFGSGGSCAINCRSLPAATALPQPASTANPSDPLCRQALLPSYVHHSVYYGVHSTGALFVHQAVRACAMHLATEFRSIDH